MVIKFVSDAFEQEVRELLSFFEQHSIDYDFYDLTDEFEKEDEDEKLVDEDYELPVWFPHSYYEETHTIGELLNVVKDANEVIEFDENKFVSKRVALFSIDDQIHELIYSFDLEIPTIQELIDGQEYTINIVNGLTSYGIKLITEDLFDKHFPPVDESDFFIEISAKDTLDIKVIESLVDAYLFELKSTLGISIQLSPRLSYLTLEDEPEFSTDITRLRPLLQGKGIHELLKLYNSSLASVSADILILTYTKVIEYVSQTVIQQDLINSATKKLFSSRALNPDANYILELGEIFDKNRNNQKDYLAIRLTIETCCDLNEIVATAPQFLKFTRKLRSDSKNEDKIKAFIEIADAISNTRNMFAHAKTNYEKKGMECPTEQLEEFAKCLDILAQQVIRWFAKEHEDNRVI
ncbi:hypothetical protein ABE073_00230 [Lederbergia citrisecunda]|uniref:hypothetical protein n=1 Tax=Lederbergia citrisecunda TaxID=2833583 RepID=UPI003D2E8B62